MNMRTYEGNLVVLILELHSNLETSGVYLYIVTLFKTFAKEDNYISNLLEIIAMKMYS